MFGGSAKEKLSSKGDRERVRRRLSEEIQEIFYSRNFLQ
jgi:hypothetical protein